MADRKATLTAVLVDAVSGPAKKIQAEITGISTSVGKVSALLAGVGVGIGVAAFDAFTHAVERVAEAIPNLLDQGHAYIDMLQQVQLETGMTAEQASTLVGSLRAMGVPIDDITQLMARLGQNIATNEGRFKQLGIATRAQNGTLLDAYTIFQNVRRAVSEHGASLLSTAAAQEIFGRSGYKIIEALQASDPEWRAATENVRRWGGVVNQSTINASDRLGDTIASLQQGITDIGVNIAAAVDPYLRAFVDAFAQFVQAHLNEIVNFAVGVVNIVTGFISGLFGITNALNVTSGATDQAANTSDKAAFSFGKAADKTADLGKKARGAAGGVDVFTASLQGQIKAIDAHIAAIEQAAERRHAVEQRAQLERSLSDARAQLSDLRGNAPFTEGLSNAETQLAIQKHAQDIKDAEQGVADARKAIGDFELDQRDRAERELLDRQKQRLQDLISAHREAAQKIAAAHTLAAKSVGDNFLRMKDGIDTSLGNIGIKTQQFAATAVSAFQTGVDAARTFLDILLGSEHSLGVEGTYRSGGVVGALQSVGDAIGKIGGAFSSFYNTIVHLPDTIRNVSDILARALGPNGPVAMAMRGFVGVLAEAFFRGLEGMPNIGIIPNPFYNPNAVLHAQGGVYDTIAPTRIGNGVMGEAAGETVAILRNPRPLDGGGGNSRTVVVNVGFVSPPKGNQFREFVDMIDEAMQMKADNSPVGISAFRGASG